MRKVKNKKENNLKSQHSITHMKKGDQRTMQNKILFSLLLYHIKILTETNYRPK